MRYNVRFYHEDGVWYAHVPHVGGKDGTLTCGDTRQEARRMARDAVTGMLLAAMDLGQEPDAPTVGDLPLGEEWEWVYPDIRIEVALAIRWERKKAGLTMQDSARRSGVALGTYQKWEDPEKCNATLKTLDRIAQAFGHDLEVSFHPRKAS